MQSIIDERQITPEQQEEFELKEEYPEKYETEFDPEVTFKVNKKAADPVRSPASYGTYSREEVAELLAATNAPYIHPEGMTMPKNYRTYTREEVAALMQEHNDYLAEEKKRSEECTKWDFQKTIGLEGRIANTKPHKN
jgi:hypothetical protein